jgi:hypothetical protein
MHSDSAEPSDGAGPVPWYRRYRTAVLSCAGAYVSGDAGSNECPAGSVRIETEAACRTAAAAAGKTFNGVWTDSAYPRGCYYLTSTNNAYFNTHAVGVGSSSRQLLCAAATTGAPPPPIRARMCTGAGSGTALACMCAARARMGFVRALPRCRGSDGGALAALACLHIYTYIILTHRHTRASARIPELLRRCQLAVSRGTRPRRTGFGLRSGVHGQST